MTLEQRQDYYDRLSRHDWFHEMSESSAVWNAGRKEAVSLQRAAAESVELNDLYDAFAEHRFNGAPKPERPS